MSTLKVTNIENPSGGGVSAKIADVGGGQLSNRNLIINGAMKVAQRGASSSLNNTSSYKTVDRFRTSNFITGTSCTVSQEADGPEGFAKSLKMNFTTGATPAASNSSGIIYKIEAQDLQRLNYGSSSAASMTLSFYVKSNKTGSASFEVIQLDNSNKLFSTSYSISSANTWEYKTITIPGDTSGLINDDNDAGVQLFWWLNSGTDYQGGSYQTSWGSIADANRNVSNLGVGSANGDYYQITGVQLEVGSVATTFEHRSFGDELAKCMRYYHRITGQADQTMICPVTCHSNNASGDDFRGVYAFPVRMRADAAMTFNDLLILHSSGDLAVTSGTSLDQTIYSIGLDMDTADTAPSVNEMAILRLNTVTTSYIEFSAEL